MKQELSTPAFTAIGVSAPPRTAARQDADGRRQMVMPLRLADADGERPRGAEKHVDTISEQSSLIVELGLGKRLSLHGTSLVRSVGDAALVEMQVVSSSLDRVEADATAAPSQSLCICQQRHGPSWFGTDLIGEFLVAIGTLAPGQFDAGHTVGRLPQPGVQLRLVTVPLVRWKASEVGGGSDPQTAQTGLKPLFSSYFASLFEQAPHLIGPAADIVVQTLVQLALATRQQPGVPAQKLVGGREARLRAVHQAIEHHLHRPDLSPATLSAMLGISVRQLHLLFEPSGTTCARYVQAKRLERARALLLQLPHRSVAEVAFACGFDSLTTFYRAFRGAFHMSPSDFRKSLGR